MNNSKKSLLMSSISLLLCISMFIGSTFAWFTDSASSAGNKIHAGTLKLDVELLDKATGEWNSLKNMQEPIFNYDKWEPGYMDAKVFKIENEGNLALKWVAKFYSEYDLSILADVIDVYVRPSDSEIEYPADRNLEGYACVGNLATFINSIEDTTYGNLEPDQESYLGIALKMREEAGNEYQGLSLGGAFDIRIYATQHTLEYDSFGNEYDQGATFDELANTSIMASASETLVSGADSVDFDLSNNGLYVAKVIVPASAIADSTQPVTVTFDGIKPSETAIIDENTQAYSFDIKVTNLKENLEGDQLVTVIVTAPNALAAMKAYHNGALIEDAVYDEVEGTITFKTANFSPFDFTSQVEEVSDLAGLRATLQKEGHTAKLIADISVDLTKGSGADRNNDHVYSGYYNGVIINGKSVGLDLNGHNIKVCCGGERNSNSDVGALFFVGSQGSLNITDRLGGGFIKMESSIYAVWAPFTEPSYVDIYGGAFIADSYAGDPIAPGGYNYNENSNRALIYAGTGGNMNIYGGYFLYNNTPDDDTDRNNGAFNAKDHYTSGPLITIYEGVYLSNKEYRQNPANTSTPNGTFDDESIRLEANCGVVKVENHSITINGNSYAVWYKVSPTYKYKITFMNGEGKEVLDTQYVMDNNESVSVVKRGEKAQGLLDSSFANDFGGWVNAASEKVETIPAGNDKNIVLYPTHEEKCIVRWLDEDGNVIANATVSKNTKYSTLTEPNEEERSSQYDNMKFDHWEIRETDDKGKATYTEISIDYTVTKDITLYPYYNYSGGDGSIALKGHDDDGDGRYDRYTVEAASNLKDSITIPGVVNGVPVSAIVDLTDNDIWDNIGGLLGGNTITSIIIEEGVEEIGDGAFADTVKLTSVTIPVSVTTIGANAFSGDGGSISGKTVTLTYQGTKEQWDNIIKDENWYGGLNSYNNHWLYGTKYTTVVCKDGTYTLGTNGQWTWTSKSN